jgi:phosphonate transport system permease protein
MGVVSTPLSRQELPFLEWKQVIAGQRWRQAVIVLGMIVLVGFAAWRCDVNLKSLTGGLGKGASLIGLFFLPDWSTLPELLKPASQTAVIAMIATILGMCLSLPCALAASSNLSPAPLRHTARAFIALERGLPEIVQMLFMIAIFGLGAVPGLIALSISSIGMLAKLLADAIEEIEPQMLEAVEGTGATRSQMIRYGVIPQILPVLLANGLFRFEVNVRAGVILGAIGAGGIGYEMSASMASLDLRRASMAALLTLALVFSAERLSEFLRERLLGKGAQLR